MVGVIESGVVHHGGNHQVDVDPQGVVEHKPDERQESEDISDGNPLNTCWRFHDGTKYVLLKTDLIHDKQKR